MKKKKWIQRALTFLLIGTLVLQPTAFSSMNLASITAAAEEASDDGDKSAKEEAKKAEAEKRKKEEEEKRRKEEEEKKRREEEEKKRKEEEEKKRKEEEEEQRKKEAVAAKKKAEEEAAAKKKAEEEAAAKKKAEEEATAKKKAEEEAKKAEKTKSVNKEKEEKSFELVFKAKDGGKVVLSSDPDDKKDKISKTVKEGKEIKVKAIAKEGYKFKKWTKGGDKYSGKAEIKVKSAKDTEYVAWFEKEPEKTEEAKGAGEDTGARAASDKGEGKNDSEEAGSSEDDGPEGEEKVTAAAVKTAVESDKSDAEKAEDKTESEKKDQTEKEDDSEKDSEKEDKEEGSKSDEEAEDQEDKEEDPKSDEAVEDQKDKEEESKSDEAAENQEDKEEESKSDEEAENQEDKEEDSKSDESDDNAVDFSFGQKYIAANNEENDNTLYGVRKAKDVIYTVEFYYQNDNGDGYTKDDSLTATRQAMTNTKVEVTDTDKGQTKGGTYVFREGEPSVLSAPVKGNGETVLKLYFDLNTTTVTVHHYLKGTTTKVKDDDIVPDQRFGSEYTATPATTYQEKDLTVDSYDPSQKITVAADCKEITIYYTLSLTITAKTDSKTYDGTPLNGEYTISGELSSDTQIIKTALGEAPSITNVSESPKNYLTTEQQSSISGIPGYYVVTYTPGTLTITPTSLAITIEGTTDTKEYSGDEQKVTGFTVTSQLPAGVSVALAQGKKAEAKGKDVKTEDDGKYMMGLAADGTDFTVSGAGNYNVTITVTDGWLKITPVNMSGTDPQGNPKIVISNPEDVYYNGREQICEITVKNVNLIPGVDFTIQYKSSIDGEFTGEDFTNAGTIQITIEGKGNYYTEKPIVKSYQILPRPVTLVSESATKEFDGKELTKPDVTGWDFNDQNNTGFVTGEVSNVEATGTVIRVGKTPNTISFKENVEKYKDSNYIITKKEGELEITPRLITVSAEDAENVTYDGKTHTGETEYKFDNLLDGYTATITYSPAEGKDAATYEGTFDKGSFKVTRVTGCGGIPEGYSQAPGCSGDLDVTDDFKLVKATPGKLTITQREITVAAPDAEDVIYDSEPHTGETEYKFDNLVEGHVGTITYTPAKGTNAGDYTGSFGNDLKVMAGKKDVTGNYKLVEKTPGKLTIILEEINDQAHLTIEKITTSETPEEGYALGDTIEYKITATNDGTLPLTNIVVTDKLTGDEWTVDSLAPGESKDFTARYTVTEADVLAKEVVNVATATATSPDPDEPEVPVDPGTDPEPTSKGEGHLTVEKVTTSQAPEGGYTVGSTINYKITVKNDGDFTITDITVTDELTGDAWTLESLAPGKSRDYTTSYTVTEADAEAGNVVNVATAKGTSPDPGNPQVPVKNGTVTENVVPPEPEPVTYSITYKLNGGSYNGSTKDIVEKYPNGTVIKVHAAPTMDGYDFDYWEGSRYNPGDTYKVTGDHVFTAQWTVAAPTPAPTPTPTPTPVPGGNPGGGGKAVAATPAAAQQLLLPHPRRLRRHLPDPRSRLSRTTRYRWPILMT